MKSKRIYIYLKTIFKNCLSNVKPSINSSSFVQYKISPVQLLCLSSLNIVIPSINKIADRYENIITNWRTFFTQMTSTENYIVQPNIVKNKNSMFPIIRHFWLNSLNSYIKPDFLSYFCYCNYLILSNLKQNNIKPLFNSFLKVFVYLLISMLL